MAEAGSVAVCSVRMASGVAGLESTAQLALDLSVAAATVLGGREGRDRREGGPVPVVGRDPRVSAKFLEAAVVAGLASSGVDVLRLGVIPPRGGRPGRAWTPTSA